MIEPYYQDSHVQIFLGDCREILPTLPKCEVITDPPYKGYDGYQWDYVDIARLPSIAECHGFWFWSGDSDFPLLWTARHIWSKANRNVGSSGEQYEEIYELNGGSSGLVFRHAVIDSQMNATLNGDIFTKHPCQKPLRLMYRLVGKTSPDAVILDPFMGSGTTLRAAKDLGRKAIGIEICEAYAEIAAERMRQKVLEFRD